MTTFTRIELVNTAIEQIRIYLKCYEKYEDIKYVHAASDVIHSLTRLDIINWDKATWLSNIITKTAFPSAYETTRKG